MTRALADHELVTSRVDSTSLNPEWVSRPPRAVASRDNRSLFDFLPATGINIGIHRSDYERLGGFSEAFSDPEDIAFSWKAHRAGLRLHLVRDAIFQCRYRDSMAGLYRPAANWGRDNVLLSATFRSEGMPGRSWSASARLEAHWPGVIGFAPTAISCPSGCATRLLRRTSQGQPALGVRYW